MARTSRPDLPAFLRSPMLADMVAAEMTAYAQSIPGESPVDAMRRATMAAVAVQVADYGTGQPAVNGSPVLTTVADGSDVEYRTG